MLKKGKSVIVIAGPTAVGKSSVAIHFAKELATEIISADSRQCYKELKIGVGRPSIEQLTAVKHHFIASHSIQEKQTAASFEGYALQKTSEIFERKEVTLMAGGTGLYIKAFCEGLDEIPEVPQEIRGAIVSGYEQKGLEWLQHEVQVLDPAFHRTGDILNPQRLIRALEVVTASGQSILAYRRNKKKERFFNVIKVGLEVPKEVLHSNINSRVDAMMEEGWVEEVRSLLPYQHLNALQTVGYKELFLHLLKNDPLQNVVEEIKTNTRRYAKRQLTWFKKDEEYSWFHPDDEAGIKQHLLNKGISWPL